MYRFKLIVKSLGTGKKLLKISSFFKITPTIINVAKRKCKNNKIKITGANICVQCFDSLYGSNRIKEKTYYEKNSKIAILS